MRVETNATGWARIYASGPIDVAKQIIRREVLRAGLCVTTEELQRRVAQEGKAS